MAGSTWGEIFRISTWGESHGKGLGVVVDGCPAGLALSEEEIQKYLDKRKPGETRYSTPRKEGDKVEILSGVFEGKTTGTPISLMVFNTSQKSKDYSEIAKIYRPGHADYTGFVRYRGFNDVRGGGHFSARLTAPLVFAGGLCRQYLKERGIYIGAHLAAVGEAEDLRFDEVHLTAEQLLSPGKRKFPVIREESEMEMRNVIEEARQNADSVGGVVELGIVGLPAGVGSPIFDTVEGRLAYGFYGIPAVKGVEFGAGFSAALLKGSENNDEFYISEDGGVKTRTNHHGGVLGGISSGMPVIARMAFKPTPSIGKPQKSIDYRKKEEAAMGVRGRHDPCVAVRAVPVAEAVAAVVITDMILEQEESL